MNGICKKTEEYVMNDSELIVFDSESNGEFGEVKTSDYLKSSVHSLNNCVVDNIGLLINVGDKMCLTFGKSFTLGGFDNKYILKLNKPDANGPLGRTDYDVPIKYGAGYIAVDKFDGGKFFDFYFIFIFFFNRVLFLV